MKSQPSTRGLGVAGERLVISVHWNPGEAGSNISEGMSWLKTDVLASESESKQTKVKPPPSLSFAVFSVLLSEGAAHI